MRIVATQHKFLAPINQAIGSEGILDPAFQIDTN